MIATITIEATIHRHQPKATTVAGNFAQVQRCYKWCHIMIISGPEMTIISITVIMTLAGDNDDR